MDIKIKRCTRCNKEKPISQFHKQKTGKYGVKAICNICYNLKQREYKRTKEGLITAIYGNQRLHCKDKNRKMPNYSKKELSKWLLNQKLFHDLYYQWVFTGFNRDLIPSIDRIDDYKSYSIDNIQLMTWRENIKKESFNRINGVNNKNNKAVLAISLHTGMSKPFHSIAEAERYTGVCNPNITKCCKGLRRSAGGYVWEYLNK